MTNIVMLLLLLIKIGDTYKILMVFPPAVPSHFFLGKALGFGLANKGHHHVTMVSPYENTTPPKNGTFKTVVINGLVDVIKKSNVPTWSEMGTYNAIQADLFLSRIGNIVTNYTMSHPNFQKLINSNQTFDVIILEQFVNDAFKTLGCHFKAPVISFSTLGVNTWINPLAGNPTLPAYIPDIFLSYTNKMSLWQRTLNFLVTLIRGLYRDLIFFERQEKIVRKYFPECSKTFRKDLYNVSLTLINSHESINYPVPLVPSMINIGGFHLDPPKKLPDKLQKFMDEATHGIIYFSLGTNVVPSLLGHKTKKTLLNVFGKLKQRVLWKWDEHIVDGKPDNVVIDKFFPQQDILSHPNMKIFITHGGLLSAIETINHGIPVLNLPVFADQRLNAARAELDGYGLSIWISNLTEENLTDALEKLLNDPKYLKNTKWRSKLLRDRPMNPMDLAIYWTEFVIRNKGASHLRVGALDLSWYQCILLDVLVIITVAMLLVVLGVVYLLKFVLKVVKKSNKIKTN